MQMSEEKQTILGGTQPSNTNLDQGILDLIKNSKSGSGLEGLLDFESKLTKNEKKLSPSEIKALLERTKKDIQNPDFLSFESGKRDDKDFGFEGLGVDVIPTLTPNGDCIIPVNFWYDGQRRTILLVLNVQSDGEANIYELPEWDNHYKLAINNIEFTYQLIQENKTFKMHYDH